MIEAPTVFIVDDEASVRAGLSRLLRSAGFDVAEFAGAQAFLDSGRSTDPGCLLLDVEMPGLSGVELQRILSDRGCLVPVIFLSGHADIAVSVRAMKQGAEDFLTKPFDEERLLAAVGAALEDNRAARAARAATDEIRQRLATLTPREREVLPLVVAGQMNKQMAARLGTAEKTIKVHRARVMHKMKVRTLAGLVNLARDAGIETPAY